MGFLFENIFSPNTTGGKKCGSSRMRICKVCCTEKVIVQCKTCEYSCCRDCYLQWAIVQINGTNDDLHTDMQKCMSCKMHIPSLFSATAKKDIECAIADRLLMNETQWVRASHAFIANEERKNEMNAAIARKQEEKHRLNESLRNIRKRIVDCTNCIAVIQQKISSIHQQTLCERCHQPCANQFCTECSVLHCHKCNQIHPPDEACNAEVQMSVQVIGQTCRSCPSCLSATYKTGGCDHVHCSACGTDWDWRTQKVVGVHESNRPYMEEFCGGLPNERTVAEYMKAESIFDQSYLWCFYKVVFRMRQRIMPVLMDATLRSTPDTNHALRLNYVRKKISTMTFKRGILRSHKKNKIKHELSLIVKSFVLSAEDVFQVAVYGVNMPYCKTLQSLQSLFNEYCQSVHKLNLSFRLRKTVSVIENEAKALVAHAITFSSNLAVKQCTDKGQETCRNNAAQ